MGEKETDLQGLSMWEQESSQQPLGAQTASNPLNYMGQRNVKVF